ncbi:hypothetical protein GCM10023162_37980 [Klenkia terrae]
MAEQPELTIQGWGPPGTRVAHVADGALELTADAAVKRTLPKAARKHLARELGWTPRSTPPVPVDLIELAPSRLPVPVRAELVTLLGLENVRDDRDSRLRRTGGKSYLDLLRRRSGDATDAPDAVLTPADTAQTAALLELCTRHGVVVVPFGGGTSVVGGLSGTDVDDRPVVVVDLSRMAGVVSVDVPSSLVTAGPGMRGPALEDALAEHDLTLGHLPQSWEFATLGGYAATRSAGQASTGIGRFDELVTALTLATPTGVLELGHAPASAGGPDLLGLALGSEGTLGVITEATVRVRPRPRTEEYEGWSFRSWAAGLAALQRLAVRHRRRRHPARDHARRHDPDHPATGDG